MATSQQWTDIQPLAPPSASTWKDITPLETSKNADSTRTVSGADDAGVWGSLKRNTVGMVSGLYHAFSDPATPAEKEQLLAKLRADNAKGDNIPEELAKNPSQATLAIHRLLTNPADLLNAKSDKELAAAKELWDSGAHWKAANLSTSGALDKVLSAAPGVGPAINSVAERAERGDVSGATTDALLAGVASRPEEVLKAAKALAKAPVMTDARQAMAEMAAGPVVRKTPAQTANDLKFGRNPAEAITREPGLDGVTVQGLRDGVQKRIGEIHQVTDHILQNHPNAGQSLDLEPIIDQAAQDAKASPIAKLNPALKDRIDGLVNNLKTEFGPLQKTPFDANNFKREIGEATKWTGQAFDNEANQFLVDVYRGIKNKVNAAVPDVKTLNERQADLLSARAALDRRIAFDTNRALSPGRAILGAGGGALGTVVGGATGGAEGAALGLAVDALRSTPSRLITGKALGNKYPFPGTSANIPATATGAGAGITSPLTGAVLASPAQLFKTGTNNP